MYSKNTLIVTWYSFIRWDFSIKYNLKETVSVLFDILCIQLYSGYIIYSTVQKIFYLFNCTVDIWSIQLYNSIYHVFNSTVDILSIQLYSSIYHVFNCTVDILSIQLYSGYIMYSTVQWIYYLFNCTLDILSIQLFSGYIIYLTVQWMYYLFNCTLETVNTLYI